MNKVVNSIPNFLQLLQSKHIGSTQFPLVPCMTLLRKVVTMLQGMQTKITAESAKKQQMFLIYYGGGVTPIQLGAVHRTVLGNIIDLLRVTGVMKTVSRVRDFKCALKWRYPYAHGLFPRVHAVVILLTFTQLSLHHVMSFPENNRIMPAVSLEKGNVHVWALPGTHLRTAVKLWEWALSVERLLKYRTSEL